MAAGRAATFKLRATRSQKILLGLQGDDFFKTEPGGVAAANFDVAA
jgi:hypothetical protein